MKRQTTIRRCAPRLVFCAALCVSQVVFAEGAPKESQQVLEQLRQATAAYQVLSKRAGKYDVVFRRDPMRPLVDSQGRVVASAISGGGLSVQGIIWSEEHPLAIIDDELYKQGDVVGIYTIVEIQQDGLLAKSGDQIVRVPLDRGL